MKEGKKKGREEDEKKDFDEQERFASKTTKLLPHTVLLLSTVCLLIAFITQGFVAHEVSNL